LIAQSNGARLLLGAITVGVTLYILRTGTSVQLLGLVPFVAVFVWLVTESRLTHATVRRVAGVALFVISIGSLAAAVYLRAR
jgi:hypothetical protein